MCKELKLINALVQNAMHHGYGPELEEAMNKAFYERFGRDILN
jgi:hypothetical protein